MSLGGGGGWGRGEWWRKRGTAVGEQQKKKSMKEVGVTDKKKLCPVVGQITCRGERSGESAA